MSGVTMKRMDLLERMHESKQSLDKEYNDLMLYFLKNGATLASMQVRLEKIAYYAQTLEEGANTIRQEMQNWTVSQAVQQDIGNTLLKPEN